MPATPPADAPFKVQDVALLEDQVRAADWPETMVVGLTDMVAVAGLLLLFDRKLAVTLIFALTVTVQVVDVPEQAPVHPLKVEPAAGDSVKVRDDPAATEAGQIVPPQVIVPEPLPPARVVTV